MHSFCTICSNLLLISTTPETFQFKCMKCQNIETPDAKSTLIYEEVSGTDFNTFKAILHNAGRDQVNPKVYKTCQCGYHICRQVRLGDEMQLINTCVKCNDQWMDGTRSTDLE